MSKIDLNKKYKTRSGCDVELSRIDLPDDSYPVVGYVKHIEGVCRVEQWTKEGRALKGGNENEYDLIEVKEKQGLYMNIYPNGTIIGRQTRLQADAFACTNRIACIYVEFEEGQGL